MPETNFMPNPASDYEAPTVFHSDSTMAAAGSPEGVHIGWPGAMYVDTDDGTLYKKVSGLGTNTGWEEHTGGGGGAGLTYHQSGDLDPNGVITGNVGDVFHSRTSLGGDGSTWWKVSGSGNTGWE